MSRKIRSLFDHIAERNVFRFENQLAGSFGFNGCHPGHTDFRRRSARVRRIASSARTRLRSGSTSFHSLTNPDFFGGQSFVEKGLLFLLSGQRLFFAFEKCFVVAFPIEQPTRSISRIRVAKACKKNDRGLRTRATRKRFSESLPAIESIRYRDDSSVRQGAASRVYRRWLWPT